jgi:hypothetical protein
MRAKLAPQDTWFHLRYQAERIQRIDRVKALDFLPLFKSDTWAKYMADATWHTIVGSDRSRVLYAPHKLSTFTPNVTLAFIVESVHVAIATL